VILFLHTFILSRAFSNSVSGGDIKFYGEGSKTRAESETISHEVGTAILHSGRHWHEADFITRGERCNLILWCRSRDVKKCTRKAHTYRK
jgi:predicted 2-oxoglutarate/Fe(II)-dependent dioxygenase YbiX